MGGTFMSLPLDYRDYFVRNLHDALSGHSSSNVAEAVRFSEQSRTRCIGLTIETRPDYCLTPHLTQVRASLLAGCSAICGLHARMLTASCLCRVEGHLDDHVAMFDDHEAIFDAVFTGFKMHCCWCELRLTELDKKVHPCYLFCRCCHMAVHG